MSTRTERFEIEGTAALELRLSRADVSVAPTDAPQIVVQLGGRDPDQVRIEQVGSTVFVREEGSRFRSPVSTASIQVPAHSRVDVDLATGDVFVDVAVTDARIRTASGDITARHLCGRAEVKSASGDVRIDRLESASVMSASGDVRIDHVDGACEIISASGDVRLGRVEGDTTIKTASGDVDVAGLAARRLDVKTASGDTAVGVAAGRRVTFRFDSLSGDARTSPPDQPASADEPREPTEITVRSLSGDLDLHATRP